MSVIKIIKIFGLMLGLAIGLLIGSTTVFAAMEIRFGWFPSLYSMFLEQLTANMPLAFGWLMLILLYISLAIDVFRRTPSSVMDAEQLPSDLFYRIAGEITEKDGKVFANLDAFGNILGNGNRWNIMAMIKKEKFPFFMLKEQKEENKIFSGIYLKITWPQNKTANKY